ncbi:MAG: amidohydrolase family protein [Planctomycetota bacterium]
MRTADLLRVLVALVASLAFVGASVPLASAEPDEPTPDEPTPDEPSPDEPTPETPEEGDEEDESESDESGSGDTEPAEDEASDEATEEDGVGNDEASEEEADEPKDELLAIIGGNVHTVTGPTIPGGTVLIRNGRIDAIGRRVTIPDEAEVIDASGHEVYPGLIAVDSSGLLSRNPREGTDPYAIQLPFVLAAGITTAITSDNAGKVTSGTLDGILLRENLFIELEYLSTEPAKRREIRRGLGDARRYLRDLAAHEREKALEKLGEDEESELEPPDDEPVKGRNSRYKRLLEGDAIARFEADEAGDLVAIADLAEEFGLRVIIIGAEEGWTVADRLGRADISVVVRPRAFNPGDDDRMRANGATIENAGILHRHGVPVAVIPADTWFTQGTQVGLWGLAGKDLKHLAYSAAFAVRGGLPSRAAIESLTITAARTLGIDDRVGSLEVGKDADVIITDGDLLHFMTHVRYAVVNGRVAYDKAEDTLFNHIRPDGDRASVGEAPADHWPRRLGEPW